MIKYLVKRFTVIFCTLLFILLLPQVLFAQEVDGMGRYIPEPHPEMIIGTPQVQPLQLFKEIGVEEANDFLMRLDRGPSTTDIQTGIELFNEAFELVSVSTAVLQDIFGVSGLERFNNIAGEIGLAGMFVSLSLKVLDEGIDDRDKLELCSNLMTYASGKWGWQGMQIANIGIFFINYSLTSFGEAAIAGRHAHWKEKYEEYNRTRNRHSMTQQEWNDFVVETALSSNEFNTVLDNRVNQYLNAFFNDDWHDGHLCPDIVRSALVDEERSRLYENELTIAIERMRDGIRERQEKELLLLMGEARDMLNSRLQIRVGVYGVGPDDQRIKNLPVRVRVERDQHLWEGVTNNGGQWWFNLTRYGYLHYESPMVVELDFEGETLTQALHMEAHGDFAAVRFYLSEEDQDDIDDQLEVDIDAQADIGAWKVATDHLIDPDGNTYTVVTIGNQVWTVENLQTTKYNDGTPIAHVTDRDAWSTLTTGAYCYYDNNPEFGDKYGALYNWYAVNTGKLAPAGWRVPSDADWTLLETYLGGRDIAGGKMKATGTLQGEDGLWHEPNTGATNKSGFTGLPGGHRHGFLFFCGLVGSGYWWSAMEYGESAAWRYSLGFGSSHLDRDKNGKTFGFSVRLVRDVN